MPSIVRREDQYLSRYTLAHDRLRFEWTEDLDQADELDDEFAVMVARMVEGKVVPIVRGGK